MNEAQGKPPQGQLPDDLAGRTVASAEDDERGHLHLRFTDGTSVVVQGLGYDGLWTDVFAFWVEGDEP